MSRVNAVRNYTMALDELFEAVRPAYMERRKAYFDAERTLIAKVLTEVRQAATFVWTRHQKWQKPSSLPRTRTCPTACLS